MKTSFCTLAIHAPYRRRARLLCADLAAVEMVILTDQPADFRDLPVRAVHHDPTGPMASEYLQKGVAYGKRGEAAVAYHDKRFALQTALRDFDRAIFLDADSRMRGPVPAIDFSPGLAVIPVVRNSIAAHLEMCGAWRLPVFQLLAKALTGSEEVLQTAPWCHEAILAVTKDGHEDRFFAAWTQAAEILQEAEVFSGEGGVIGLAAVCAGWTVNYDVLYPLAIRVRHESGGPKED